MGGGGGEIVTFPRLQNISVVDLRYKLHVCKSNIHVFRRGGEGRERKAFNFVLPITYGY